VSSSDFRHLALRGDKGKADRLLRAAVAAFASLARPSRRELAQLEDLALPLLPAASVETKRFVAAALSECATAPAVLVRQLADATIDIAAPLLIRANSLTDVDLIALIGRHGVPHARAIARRRGLEPTIAALIRALLASSGADESDPAAVGAAQETANDHGAGPAGNSEAERMRRRLRSLMRPAEAPAVATEPPLGQWHAFRRLVDAALGTNPLLFQAALAELLGITLGQARRLAQRGAIPDLVVAWKALALAEEQACLLTVALRPGAFDALDKIRAFIDSYRALGAESARQRLQAIGQAPRDTQAL
jgi:uncharacterized protein (DUF2336 family)